MTDYDEHGDAYLAWCESDRPYWLIEQTRFFEVLGSVRGLDVLELACGDGRISRLLAARGARSVLATDVSEEMIARAIERKHEGAEDRTDSDLRFRVVDACDPHFVLAAPVDRVVAMYLFHYASSRRALDRMAGLIARNLGPGGRFVAYTLSPTYDLSRGDPRLERSFGFSYRVIDPPHHRLVIGDGAFDIFQWSEADHREALEGAGLVDVRWHAPCLPADRADLAPAVQWYLDDPSCGVVSAVKPGRPARGIA